MYRFAAACLALLPVTAFAGGFVVTKVVDGNTVEAGPRDDPTRPGKIKLALIEAPRLGQPFGEEAKAHLLQLVGDRWVKAECYWFQDGYDTCDLEVDGKTVNLDMLRSGLAVIHDRYKANPSYAYNPKFQEALAAEGEARRLGVGMWSQPAPVMPWVWDAKKAAEKPAVAENAGKKKVAGNGATPAKQNGATESGNGAIQQKINEAAGRYLADKMEDELKDGVKDTAFGILKKKLFGLR